MVWYDRFRRQRPAALMPPARRGAAYEANERSGFMPKMTTLVAADEKGRIMETPLKSADVMALFNDVENDPLAGMGSLSKREIFIDKLFAKIRTASAVQAPAAASGSMLKDPPPVTGTGKPGDKTG